ncbi:MAG: SpoIIE family protein phosphatase [Terracidiphilus sp.]
MVCLIPRRAARRLLAFSALALLFVSSAWLRAQVFDATGLREPHDLDGLWRVQAGDNPAWAGRDFDDSAWPLFDPHSSIRERMRGARPDVIWYRLRIRVAPDETGLALREVMLAHAYEIYGNGERLLSAGRVAPYADATTGARRLAPIPARMVATGWLVVAVRVHITVTDWTGTNPGLYASNLTLGQYAGLERDDWLALVGENALIWAGNFSLICLGLAALVLFIAQPTQREYIWIVVLAGIRLVQIPYELVSLFREIPIVWQVFYSIPNMFLPLIYTELYCGFAGLRMRSRWRIVLVVVGVLNGVAAAPDVLQDLIVNIVPQVQLALNLPFALLLAVVLPLILARSFRRGNHEAGILIIPILLLSLYVYAKVILGTLYQFPSFREMAIVGINHVDRVQVGPFTFALNVFSGFLSTLALGAILLLRSSRVSRQQAVLDSEMAAAREVQQVMLPEQFENVPGFSVETAYEPAQQVGGDFFQVLPDASGGLLLVVGDVAGKGLPAAMLVSALVGAIRSAAVFIHDPAAILHHLNRGLAGRDKGGFTTALAAHIDALGHVRLANAGHLSPYLDGREIDLPGALPLGFDSATRYETVDMELAPGSRLTFYSDGVVEAQNAAGQLLGFERARELSTEPAARILETARAFGQSDDITVVAITRAAAAVAV